MTSGDGFWIRLLDLGSTTIVSVAGFLAIAWIVRGRGDRNRDD